MERNNSAVRLKAWGFAAIAIGLAVSMSGGSLAPLGALAMFIGLCLFVAGRMQQ